MQSDLKLKYNNSKGLFYIVKRDKFSNSFNDFGVYYKEKDLKNILYHSIINNKSIIDIKDKTIPSKFEITLEKITENGDANYFKYLKRKDGSKMKLSLIRKKFSIKDYINMLYLDVFLSNFFNKNL